MRAFAELALVAFQGELGRAVHDRGLVARELVLVEQLAHFHLDELQELGVVDHVALVHVDDDVGHAHLARQQDVLAGLRHRAVGGRDDQDRAVHLRRAGDHVLDVVGVPGAVDVGVVPVLGLVLDVGGVDGDAARLLFGRRVDLVVRLGLAAEQLAQHRSSAPPSASSCRGPRGRSCPRSRAAWCARICSLPFARLRQEGLARKGSLATPLSFAKHLVPMARIERATSPLPRECSTTEPHGPDDSSTRPQSETELGETVPKLLSNWSGRRESNPRH